MTISLCMIAKDEETYLRECLESVKDHVDEIIVVLDDRSSDRTKEIAEEFGAQVYPFSWVGDFSAARNESLRYATKDWILCLDGDEVIAKKDMDALKELLAETRADAFLIDQRNYTEDNKLRGWVNNDDYAECRATGYHVTPIVRIFKNNKGYHFRNRVHEEVDTSILDKGGSIRDSRVQVHHYGILKGNMELKRDTYLHLGKQMISDDPDNVRPRYEISRIHKARKEWDKAIEQLDIVIKSKPGYRQAMVNLADCYRHTGRMEEAVKCYREAIRLNPKNENAYINYGIMLFEKGKFLEAIELFKLAVTVAPKSPNGYHNLVGALVKAKRLGEAFSVSLSAYQNTGGEKFRETADKLRERLGPEAEVFEALHKNDYTKAEMLLKSLIKDKPEWYGHYLNLSGVYLQAGRREDARAVLNQGLLAAEDKDPLQKRLLKI